MPAGEPTEVFLMVRKHQWTMKLMMSVCVLGAGVLPGVSCNMQVRDAAVNGVASFVGTTVTSILNGLVPADVLSNTRM